MSVIDPPPQRSPPPSLGARASRRRSSMLLAKNTDLKRNYKHYSPEQLAAAKDAAQNGSSIRTASELFSVPSTTVHRYTPIPGTPLTEPTTRRRPPTVFTTVEEAEIVESLLNQQLLYCSATKVQINACIFKYLEEHPRRREAHGQRIAARWELNGSPGKDWIKGFLFRWPALKMPENLEEKLPRSQPKGAPAHTVHPMPAMICNRIDSLPEGGLGAK